MAFLLLRSRNYTVASGIWISEKCDVEQRIHWLNKDYLTLNSDDSLWRGK